MALHCYEASPRLSGLSHLVSCNYCRHFLQLHDSHQSTFLGVSLDDSIRGYAQVFVFQLRYAYMTLHSDRVKD